VTDEVVTWPAAEPIETPRLVRPAKMRTSETSSETCWAISDTVAGTRTLTGRSYLAIRNTITRIDDRLSTA
jgi:hypothetical protein